VVLPPVPEPPVPVPPVPLVLLLVAPPVPEPPVPLVELLAMPLLELASVPDEVPVVRVPPPPHAGVSVANAPRATAAQKHPTILVLNLVKALKDDSARLTANVGD